MLLAMAVFQWLIWWILWPTNWMELFINKTDPATNSRIWHSKWIEIWGKKSCQYMHIDATGTVD
jgi:hypothetical protein